jgi:hypothetical protein
MTGGPEYRGRSALWHPDSQSSTGKSTAGQDRVESIDTSRNGLRRPVGNRRSIGKAMLDEGANGGVAIRHGSARISRTYPEGKKGTDVSAMVF